jgi:iron complex outermembrane receptor protein
MATVMPAVAFGAEPAVATEGSRNPESTQLAQAQAQAGQAATATVEKFQVTAKREQYRGDVAVEDLPQSVQVITGETLKQIGAVKLNDALDLATGVARQNTFGGLWDGFAIRGFAGDLNVPSGYLVNGFNGGRGFGGLRDTSSIERMEILRGPTSALFGRGEPGGTVSIITKKPQFNTEGSGTLSLGSHSFRRLEGDITGAVSDSTAMRFNGAWEDADSYRDTVHTKRRFFSPSLFSRLGADTTLSYEMEWSQQEIPFDRGVVARNGELGVIPVSRYLGEPGDGPTRVGVRGHQLELQHSLDAKWAVLIGASHRTTDLDGIGQNPELAAARQPFLVDGRTLSRQRRFTDYGSKDTVGRAELSGSFKLAEMTHHVLFGGDYEEFKLNRLQTRYRPPAFNASSTLATMNAVDIFNPVYGNAPVANQNVFNDTETDKSYGYYFSDQVDLSRAWKLRLGGRFDSFKQGIDNRLATLQPPNQDVTKFSPQAGLMYRMTDDVSLYTAYGEGFRPNTGFDVNRNPFAPELTKSYEAGARYASDDGKMSGTIAVFKMKKTNVLTADPVNAGQTIAIGEAESKGIEVDFAGTLPGRIDVMLSYAYTDAYSASDVRDVDFARVVSKGDPLLNVPKHNASLLASRNFNVDGQRLNVGGGLKYVSSRLGETGTSFFLPAYTLLRVFGTYDVTKNFSVTAEVNNVTDKVYYPASFAALWVFPGAPRDYQLRGSYRF